MQANLREARVSTEVLSLQVIYLVSKAQINTNTTINSSSNNNNNYSTKPCKNINVFRDFFFFLISQCHKVHSVGSASVIQPPS